MTANVNAELHALQHRERHAHGQHISHDVDGLCLGFRCGRRSQQNLQQGNHILWQAGQHRLIQHFCRSIWHAPLNKIVSNIQICPMIIVRGLIVAAKTRLQLPPRNITIIITIKYIFYYTQNLAKFGSNALKCTINLVCCSCDV